MYTLRQMDVDDKVCEQVDMTLLEEIYPRAVVERCLEESAQWSSTVRRVRGSTGVSLVLFVIAMGLWSRLRQPLVWLTLVSKLAALHPGRPSVHLQASDLSNRRAALGSQAVQALFETCCVCRADPQRVPSAYSGRYRIMAIDGTLFNAPDTPANDAAFGRSHNQCGKGAYPQVRCVILCECGTHLVVGMRLMGYGISEEHGAHQLVEQLGPTTLLTIDAGLTSGGLLERARSRGAHVLGALQAKTWDHLRHQRRLSDGSVLGWVPPSRPSDAIYPLKKGMWVRILSYQLTDERLGEPGRTYRLVTTLLNARRAPARELIELYHERWEIELVLDEIKTHQRAQRKVLRSKTPEGVRQELFGIFLAQYAVRVHLLQAAVQADLDPDRLSFTAGCFHLLEFMDLAQIVEPASTQEAVPAALQQCLWASLAQHVLPARSLRINRREVKQVYNKYKPKKRDLPPPAPFEPHEHFLDFVCLLDPLAVPQEVPT